MANLDMGIVLTKEQGTARQRTARANGTGKGIQGRQLGHDFRRRRFHMRSAIVLVIKLPWELVLCVGRERPCGLERPRLVVGKKIWHTL
jgi:hypothetical protein